MMRAPGLALIATALALWVAPAMGVQPMPASSAMAAGPGMEAMAGHGMDPMAGQGDPALVARGEAIYRHGRLGDGSRLVGRREQGRPDALGEDAACVNCHRRSGLGTREGRIRIPPVTGRFLTPPHGENSDKPDLPYVENMHGARSAYDEPRIARAIRQGLDADGKQMTTLMPRFEMGEADMRALIAYLRSLDREVEPGVGDKVLHFATIVTPDADPVRREATLAVLRQFVHDKNEKAFMVGPTAPIKPSGHMMTSKMLFLAPRRWELHVWELKGPPEQWQEQLHGDFAREPVLAVISGVGGRVWEPVHRFCEQDRVPCIFPNVDLPVDGPEDFYPLYFSRGLNLEADLFAQEVAKAGVGAKGRVLQVFRAGSTGELAAAHLAASLHEQGISSSGHGLPASAGAGDLRASVAAAGAGDTLVLWLGAADIAALGDAVPTADRVLVSGRLAGYEKAPLPAAWREHALMAFGVDLPDKRFVRIRYAQDWLRARQVPITDLPVQADTWLACSILTETINDLVDAFIPEYLVERIQEDLEHRFITGYYPHLSLAEHQRFASKGGTLVRFTQPSGETVQPVGPWMAPLGS